MPESLELMESIPLRRRTQIDHFGKELARKGNSSVTSKNEPIRFILLLATAQKEEGSINRQPVKSDDCPLEPESALGFPLQGNFSWPQLHLASSGGSFGLN